MELKQFTQGEFANAFEGSAADFLKQTIPPVTAPAVPPTPTIVPPVPPVPDPLKPDLTLDPEKDAAGLMAEQKSQDAVEEPEEEPKSGEPAKPKPGRPIVEKLDDSTKTLLTGLINDKKLFGFSDGKLDTKKDVEDLLEANLSHRIEAQQKEIYDSVFKSMTPAMQMVAQYANQVDSPSDLLPLLQTTSNIERFSKLDETNPIHQEAIVREKMRLAGDTEDIIEQEIADLKDRAKLADKAKTYKPAVQQFYEREAQRLLLVKQQEEQQYMQLVQQNDQNIRKLLDGGILDGVKLKQAHKATAYELLAVPREEYGGGLGIYHVIDTLFQEGKFDRLAKIALLAGDEKAFEELISNRAKFDQADRTIRVLNTGQQSAGPTVTADDEPTPGVPTPTTLVRPTRTGFGFNNK